MRAVVAHYDGVHVSLLRVESYHITVQNNRRLRGGRRPADRAIFFLTLVVYLDYGDIPARDIDSASEQLEDQKNKKVTVALYRGQQPDVCALALRENERARVDALFRIQGRFRHVLVSDRVEPENQRVVQHVV